MELMTLDSDFQPDVLVENYESLIWTERYGAAGDFQIKSADVDYLFHKLPRESFVCLRESTVPMVVEVVKINKPPRAAPSIEISGRSFETVLERRAAAKTVPTGTNTRSAWLMAASNESDAAYRALRTVLGDEAQFQSGDQVLPLLTPVLDALDAIPEIDLVMPADYNTSAWTSAVTYATGDIVGSGTTIYQALSGNTNVTPAGNPATWAVLYTGLPGTWGDASRIIEINPGDLYTTVMELIATNHHGIKAVRPDTGSTQIGIEIYNGADLTDSVVFDVRFDQFDDSTYLLSEQGSTNVAYAYGPGRARKVLKTAAAEPSGLARRVLLLDLVTESNASTAESLNSRGLIELYNYNATALFDGQISIQLAAGYNSDYFLGDILKLTGEYGLSEDVRVAEFIRSSDKSGTKAYPTFEAVS